jgi:murein DD-endopeptidase MepM/ murein hydrolase activator NlpD
VAAVATGAVVAAGQTLAAIAVDRAAEPVTIGALAPVAEIREVAEPAVPVKAIGGDQLVPNTLTTTPLDPQSQVDVQNLAKAVDFGRKLTQRAALLDAALADGAPAAFLRGTVAFVQPLEGRFTSGFGARWGTSHQGIDIANRIGTPIFAVTDGVVEESGPASGFGLWVKLRHADGTQSVYGHINRAFVRVGDHVRAGERIAEVGNRGRSTGPHLHFEVWDVDGTKLNPLTWLRAHGIEF